MTEAIEIDNELIVVQEPNALEVFTTPDRVAEILKMIRKKIDAFEPVDATTEEGRATIKSRAHAVSRSKTALETVGKRLADDAKALPKKIDAGRRKFDEQLSAWRDEVRKPVTEWEAREAERCKKHEDTIGRLRQLASVVQSGNDVVERLEGMKAAVDEMEVSPAACEEFEDGYRLAKDAALSAINTAIERRRKFDADQAELARLREVQAAQEAREREEKEAAARKEREDRIAKEAEEKAQRDAQAAAAARERELQRQVDEAAQRERQAQEAREREEKETAAREADRAHRQKVNQAAVFDLIHCTPINEEQAKAIVKAIAKGQIGAVSIRY